MSRETPSKDRGERRQIGLREERDHYKADLEALRGGVEAEVERLRSEAEALGRTENDPRYGPVVIAEAHVLRIASEETADRLQALLGGHDG